MVSGRRCLLGSIAHLPLAIRGVMSAKPGPDKIYSWALTVNFSAEQEESIRETARLRGWTYAQTVRHMVDRAASVAPVPAGPRS